MLLLQMQTWIVSCFQAKWQAINRTRSSWVSEHDLASKVIFPDCCTCRSKLSGSFRLLPTGALG